MYRRDFVNGLLAMPVIIRIPGLLMPIKSIKKWTKQGIVTQTISEVEALNLKFWDNRMIPAVTSSSLFKIDELLRRTYDQYKVKWDDELVKELVA